MSFYVPLSIKYRPKNLDDIIGQDKFVSIIDYIIKQQKLHYAYIFSGTRGVGKTTLARIIAKLINCESLIKAQENSLVKACGVCKFCSLMSQQNVESPDIIEIDAASNTSVENMRNIIESTEYLAISKYKVFIIDEVHMLSKSAFNAFLKTLEEPKNNTIFILATTEIEKVPLTIISRCQRFDLSEISTFDITKLLKKICTLENVAYEDQAIEIIAYLANSSARDGLSLLEQAINYAQSKESKELSFSIVSNLFSIISNKELIKIIDNILSGNILNICIIIKNLNIMVLVSQLLDLLSSLIKIKLYNKSANDNTLIAATSFPEFNFNDTFSSKRNVQRVSSDNIETQNIKDFNDIQVNIIKNYSLDIITLANKIEINQINTIWQILVNNLENLKTITNKISYFEVLVSSIIDAVLEKSYLINQKNQDNYSQIKAINDVKSIAANDIKSIFEITKTSNTTFNANADALKENNINIQAASSSHAIIDFASSNTSVNSASVASVLSQPFSNTTSAASFPNAATIATVASSSAINSNDLVSSSINTNSNDLVSSSVNINSSSLASSSSAASLSSKVNTKLRINNALENNLLNNSILNQLIKNLNDLYEFEIYYFLMNYCNINFNNKVIEIYIIKNDLITIKKLKTFLSKQDYVTFQYFMKDNINSLKLDLQEAFALSNNAKILSGYFNYKLLDVVHQV